MTDEIVLEKIPGIGQKIVGSPDQPDVVKFLQRVKTL